jgi:4-carboxymuconolactone decarboxylase
MAYRRNKPVVCLAPIVAALALLATAPAAGAAQPGDEMRCAPGASSEAIAAPMSPLARARHDCPLLATIIEEYAARDLGEDFSPEATARPSLDLTLATRFAVLGDISGMTRHALRARDAGTESNELRELLYLTAVTAGLPKAMEATQALADVLRAPLAASPPANREACTRPNIRASGPAS